MSRRAGGRDSDVHVTLHHRTGEAELGRVQAVAARLDGLERTGVLAGYDRAPWPDAVPLDGDSGPVEVYRSCGDWAERNDVGVEPPFRVTQVPTPLHASDEMLRTPTICLAVHRDGEIAGVYPHATDDGIVDVQEGIDRIQELGGTGLRDTGPDRDAGDRTDDGEDGRDRHREPPTV